MEIIDRNYNRLFKATVLCICIAVMIIAMRTRPADAGDAYASQTEYSSTLSAEG